MAQTYCVCIEYYAAKSHVHHKENKGGIQERLLTMKIQEDQSTYIRDAFNNLKDKEDFLSLLNYVKTLIFGAEAKPFEMSQLNYHCNPQNNKARYYSFSILKKSGALRTIHAPNKGLKALQKCLNIILQVMFDPHKSATGFIPGKSVVDNAAIHTGKNYVYNIDLKDFFPIIEKARVYSRMLYPPFNLSNEKSKLANIIAGLCCQEMEVERQENGEWVKKMEFVLPQGAPTSPTITNIICERLDRRLSGAANRFGLTYSRYADDITFSSNHNNYLPESDFLKEVERIVTDQKFIIKSAKTRLQKQGYRQEVTGLLVNKNVNVQQRYIKELRMWLYYWERYGYDRAYEFFLPRYKAEKGHVKKGKPNLANVIAGKLDYLKMIKGIENGLYLKLKRRFDALIIINKDKALETAAIQAENLLSLADINNTSSTKEEVHQQHTDRLRININPIDFVKGQIKLKRKIIIDKGENLPLEEFLENNEGEEKEIDLSKHKPIDVNRFLLNFRASEGLKFLTHDYDKTDSQFEYADILKVAKKEFEDLSTRFVIPQNLYARINQFAFGNPDKFWMFNNTTYKLNWKTPELLSWMESNPHTHPIRNEYFEKGLIVPFKKSIEIKAPELEYIFKNKLAENLGSNYLSFDIRLIDLDKANFYTNVDALQVGVSYLIKAIKQRFNNSNKIKVEFSRKADAEGRKRIIKIVHIGSESNKPLDKKELLQGDLLEAEKAFFGICDWTIISKSPHNSVNKLNILFDVNSEKIPKEKIDDRLIEGFTHVLTFYS